MILRQFHEPHSTVERRHDTGTDMQRDQLHHDDIDLKGRHANRAGNHLPDHVLHGWIAPRRDPMITKAFAAQPKISLRLLPNPLEQDKLGSVDISISTDAKGSFLKAGDGLPRWHV